MNSGTFFTFHILTFEEVWSLEDNVKFKYKLFKVQLVPNKSPGFYKL